MMQPPARPRRRTSKRICAPVCPRSASDVDFIPQRHETNVLFIALSSGRPLLPTDRQELRPSRWLSLCPLCALVSSRADAHEGSLSWDTTRAFSWSERAICDGLHGSRVCAGSKRKRCKLVDFGLERVGGPDLEGLLLHLELNLV